MGDFIRKVGEPLKLNATLGSEDTDKFIQAELRDAVGALLAPPTQAVPHISEGFHLDITRLMPDIQSVFVKYRVFNDASFTERACEFPVKTDIFRRDAIQEAIDKLLVESRKSDFTSTVLDEDAFSTKIMDDDEVQSMVSDKEDMTAQVSDDDALESTVSDPDALETKVGDCND